MINMMKVREVKNYKRVRYWGNGHYSVPVLATIIINFFGAFYTNGPNPRHWKYILI